MRISLEREILPSTRNGGVSTPHDVDSTKTDRVGIGRGIAVAHCEATIAAVGILITDDDIVGAASMVGRPDLTGALAGDAIIITTVGTQRRYNCWRFNPLAAVAYNQVTQSIAFIVFLGSLAGSINQLDIDALEDNAVLIRLCGIRLHGDMLVHGPQVLGLFLKLLNARHGIAQGSTQSFEIGIDLPRASRGAGLEFMGDADLGKGRGGHQGRSGSSGNEFSGGCHGHSLLL